MLYTLYIPNGNYVSDPDYLEYMAIPSYEDTLTRNLIRFSECGGYTFAHTYIEFLDETYVWEYVLQLIQTEDYESVFGKTDREIYEEWVTYIKNYHD